MGLILILAWMYSTSELDELFQILNSIKGFKLNNHKGATQQYQLNPDTYLPQGIIPLDLIHSFEKMPRTLQLPFLNTAVNYKSMPKGSL